MPELSTLLTKWWRTVAGKAASLSRRAGTPLARSSGLFVERLEDRQLPTAIFGLTPNNMLAKFESSSPANLNLAAVKNLDKGDTLVALDFQPGTSTLYALGVNGKIGDMYVIDLSTVTATRVGSSIIFPVRGGLPLPEDAFGFDFDPVTNVIRIVANNRDNFRWDPATGKIVASDEPLNPGNPVVVGAAYSNNFPGARSTTLYVIDASTDQLFVQGGNPVPPGESPKLGKLTPVGNLGVHLSSNEVGFDIAEGTTALAFASLQVDVTSGLYSINVKTGAAALLGSFGGVIMRDISVAPNPDAAATHFAVSAPATATAGVNINFTVIALDKFNQPTPYYSGRVRFTSSDSAATLPSLVSLDNGVGAFGATFKTVGNQTIIASDSANASITGTSNPIAVSSAPAARFKITAPTTAAAGTPLNFTVTALDRFNNPAPVYSGTVTFFSNDNRSVLPPDSKLTNGAGTFSATLNSSGTFFVGGKDTVAATIAGDSNPIVVSAATDIIVSAPPTASAGAPFSFTVRAVDQFGNTATGYRGTVHFTKTDTAAGSILPADYTFTVGAGGDNGVHTFTNAATMVTAGTQTITATDTAKPSISGVSKDIVVNAAAATRFSVSAPKSSVAGVAFGFDVTALDQFGNTAKGYTGTVGFTSTDGAAILPPNSTLTNGIGTFSATLKSVGNQTITATDTVTSGIKGTSGSIAVSAAAATRYALSAPSSTSGGTPFSFTVTALDQFNNTATAYNGTVHFTSTDSLAVLPPDSKLTNGAGTFSATLKSAGTFYIGGTDTVTSSITGTSNAIVNAVASRFVITAPATATAGSPFSFTVKAVDQFGNTATGYTGTVHFTKSDTAAGSSVPPDYTFTVGAGGDNGIHVFTNGATLVTAGEQTITATDTVNPNISDSSDPIAVSPAAATHFSVSAPPSAIAGTACTFSVNALDQFNNLATGYSGTVQFTSTDGVAALPADSTLTNGSGTFSATLKTPGIQTINAKDSVTSSITGTSDPINVSSAAATHFAVSAPGSAAGGTPFDFTVTALDQFNNTVTSYSGTIHFTSTDSKAMLPADSSLTNGTRTLSATLKSAGIQFITATDTVSAAITGTSKPIVTTVAVRFIITAPPTAAAGAPFSFTVKAVDQFDNTATGYTGTVHFTKSDTGGGSSVPADYTFTVGAGGDNGVHVFTNGATLVTAGNQNITGTDIAVPSITDVSNDISVSSATATRFVVSAPATAVAGTAFGFTVQAVDGFNNTATGYSGTVRFNSSDGQASLPSNSTLTSGFGTFSASMRNPGNQTITATDTASSSNTGISNQITVSPAPATRFAVSAPNSAAGGTPFTFTVTALNQFNETAVAYSGMVHFTSTDNLAALPVDSKLTNGAGSFTATLKSPGDMFITATDTVSPPLTGTSNPISTTVATRLVITAPSLAAAGVSFSISVRAVDQFGNIATGYSGTIHFTKSDSGAGSIVPADYTFTVGPSGDNGTHTFTSGVTFVTAGEQAITATDTVSPSITDDSDPIVVSAAAATRLVISAPPQALAGNVFGFGVQALDQFGNQATGYTGAIQFTTTDGGKGATVPAIYTFTVGPSGDNGNHVFANGALLVTAGSQTISARDLAAASIQATSNSISVSPAAASHFVVSAPPTSIAGSALNLVVVAKDPFNNTLTEYTGTVHFSSSDAQAVLPADSLLISGTGIFTASLRTSGEQTLTASDTVSTFITGMSDAIAVSAASATHFSVEGPFVSTASLTFPITVTALDAFGNVANPYVGTINFTSSDPRATLPGNYKFTSSDAGVHVFNGGLLTAGLQSLKVADAANASISGAAEVIVNPAINVVGAAAGQPPFVRVFNVDGTLRFSVMAFDPNFTGGVSTALGDLDADGVQDIIVGAGHGGGPNVVAFSGKDGHLLVNFFAFDPRFTGGVNVASADINGDGFDDIVVGAGPGGGPDVAVVSGRDGARLFSFFAFDPQFTGGVSVAAGDINGDGFAEIILGAGPGGGPNVVVVDGKEGKRLASFFAFNPLFTGGVSVAAGDLDNTGIDEIVVGAGVGGGPNVTVFAGISAMPQASFMAFDPDMTAGIRVGTGHAAGTNRPAILTGRGYQAVSFDRAFDGITLQSIDQFFEAANL